MAGRLESDAALGMRSRLPEAPPREIPPALLGSLVGITILARVWAGAALWRRFAALLNDSFRICFLLQCFRPPTFSRLWLGGGK